jgi:hypothetical protein
VSSPQRTLFQLHNGILSFVIHNTLYYYDMVGGGVKGREFTLREEADTEEEEALM